jgi:hypothetical protein
MRQHLLSREVAHALDLSGILVLAPTSSGMKRRWMTPRFSRAVEDQHAALQAARRRIATPGFQVGRVCRRIDLWTVPQPPLSK